MKFTTYLSCLFVMIAFQAFCQEADSDGYVLVRKSDDLVVHEKWGPYPDRLPVISSREIRGQFTANASMYEVLSIIKDKSKVKYWQSHVSEFDIFLRPDTTCWDEYSRHDIPWPMDDQDSFMEYKVWEIVPDKEMLIAFRSRTDNKLAPLYEDVNRIELTGSWKFEQVSPGILKVTYKIQSVPTTNLPKILIDPVVRNNLMSTMQSLKELLEKD